MNQLDIQSVQRRLPGRRMDWHDTIDSTMHEAECLAAQGAAAGTAVIAEEQTAGLGRHGHSWYSELGAGLYVSIVLRPGLSSDALPVLMIALGLAAADAIHRTADLQADLRWPNDLMLGGRKVAGILVQLHDSVAIAGIGINVNHAAFPEEIAREATSLRIASGRTHSREELLVALLQAVDSFSKMLAEGGKQPILDLFARCSTYARGKRVRVALPEGVLEGTTAGLDPSGFLIVRRDDGSESLVLAGGVRAV